MAQDNKPAGAGSGGGGDPNTQVHGHYFDGTYAVVANQVEIVSRPPDPPVVPDACVITVLGAGLGTDGRVDVRGTQGVRVTAGPPMLPPVTNKSVNGVEIVVGETQNVTIQRGLIPDVDQQIVMAPGSITVDGGAGSITIKSLTNITLQVAGGLSTISLTPAGIVIQGLLVKIN